MRVECFTPIIDNYSTTLILGTAPGGRSLLEQEYYAHAGNGFWPLMANILNTEIPTTYEEKKQMLLSNRIALWDVLKKCDRVGSGDAAITNDEGNDFNTLLLNTLQSIKLSLMALIQRAILTSM